LCPYGGCVLFAFVRIAPRLPKHPTEALSKRHPNLSESHAPPSVDGNEDGNGSGNGNGIGGTHYILPIGRPNCR